MNHEPLHIEIMADTPDELDTEATARIIADLLAALLLLTNGYKYPTDVCQIARAAITRAASTRLCIVR